MPIAAYEIPQAGSFVAEPLYGGHYPPHSKWGASYAAAPPHASYQPNVEYGMYGSATPPFPYGHTKASAPASYQQYAMPSTASFTHEQPLQQTYQMPQTASFTNEQPFQQYSYQHQYSATRSIPQQPSFAAYPQQPNYPYTGDMPQFQFYPSAPPGVDRQLKQSMSLPQFGPADRESTSLPQFGPGHAKPTEPVNHSLADPGQVKPTGPMKHAPAGHGRDKSPIRKPNSSTSRRPPTKRTAKKNQGCCSCGV